MNKEQIKDEIILAVKEAFNDNAEPTPFVRGYIELDGNDIDHISEQTAETLYNAGYRKTFTSDIASDTQKAVKEGYQKALAELEEKLENGELVSIDWHDEQVLHAEDEIERLKAQLHEYKKPIDKFIKDRENQAVKEFAEYLKEYARACKSSGYDGIGENDIDDLLKEYEQ